MLTPMHFKQVFNQPIRVGTPQLTFLAVANQLSHPRLGLAISKKSDKRAVARNRIKRHVRESFRLNQQQLSGLDIVVISKRGVSELDDAALNKMLDKSWQRLLRRFATS